MAGTPLIHSVVVTGANRGIGLELVKHFLRMPNPPEVVFATCRDSAGPGARELRTLASRHPNLAILQLEATDGKSVQAAVKSAEARLAGAGLNLLINNAGVMPPCPLESATPAGMLEVYNINLVGPMLVTKAFLPALRTAAQASEHQGLSCRRAAIVNMSTVLGSLEKTPELFSSMPVVSYRCSKAALNMLTKCQAIGYREEGILCAAIHPGWVRTELGGEQAPLTVEESVAGIMTVLGNLSEKEHGTLLSWEGETLPW
nr:uncharacterized protein LOC110081326 [Pogona vitticeps]